MTSIKVVGKDTACVTVTAFCKVNKLEETANT